jgi:hypothetical protein
LVACDGAGYATQSGPYERAFPLVSGLMADNGTQSGTRCRTDDRSILDGCGVAANEVCPYEYDT